MYIEKHEKMTNENDDNTDYVESDLEIQILPAEQVDEESWDDAVVYDDSILEPLTVQKILVGLFHLKNLRDLLASSNQKVVKSLFLVIFIRI